MGNEIRCVGNASLTTLNTVVGMSYHALTSPYVTPQDVMTRYPILNMDALNVVQKKEITNETTVQTGSSLKEMAEAFSLAVSASGKYAAFSGSVSTDFGTEKKSANETTYQKVMSVYSRRREFLDGGDEYRNHLHPQFVSDLKTMDPNDLFEKYGTHLITEACFGGRMELNFTYQKERNESSEKVKASITAACGEFSAKSDTSYSSDTKSVVEKSEISIRVVGGSSTGIFDVKSFSEHFNAWAKSLDEEKNQEFCSIPRPSALVPLWELCDDASRRSRIEGAYLNLARTNINALMAGDLYVTDVAIVSAKKAQEAKLACPKGYILVDKDLNAGAGGNYIYLCYKLEPDAQRALTNCALVRSKSKQKAATYMRMNHNGVSGVYDRLGADLNKGAGGDYIYLCHSRSDGYPPIKRLEVIFDGQDISSDWEAVTWMDTKTPADCNRTVGGKYIYIMMKREG